MSEDTVTNQAQPVDFDPFAGSAVAYTAPTTEAQQELWTGSQVEPGANAAFNESVTLEFFGPLDRPALEAALRSLIARHEALRGVYSSDGTAFVITEPALDLVFEDLAGLDAGARDRRVASVIDEQVEKAFDLRAGPLARFRLLALGAEHHLLTLTGHHSVCDGWSLAVLVEDLGHAYSAVKQGAPDPLAGRPRFSDYARGEWAYAASAEGKATERYWLAQYAGSIPVLDLPTDRPRPPRKTYASRREDHRVGAEWTAQVKAFGGKHGASFFVTLLTAYEALILRLTGEGDIVVGIPAAGQSVVGEGYLVGHCVNMLPLRTRLSPDDSFAEALRKVRTAVLDGYEHQRFTFGALLKQLPLRRDPSRLPLVSVLFNVDQAVSGAKLSYHGLRVEYRSNPRNYETFDMFINVSDRPDRTVFETQYNTDLFDRATIVRWLEAMKGLVDQAVQDPERKLRDFNLLSPALEESLARWNATRAEYPRQASVQQLFEEAAGAHAEKIAVISGQERLTYAALNERANRIAHVLVELGVGRGDLVGLCVPRSADMVAAMLGILKTGAAYVPMDPSFPLDRIAYMVADARARALITTAGLERELPADHGAAVLTLDGHAARLAAAPAANPAPPAGRSSEDRCYVIYTSGSTGKPKGVEVPHRAVVNFLWTMAREPGLTAGDRVLAVTTLSFDIAVLELHLPLTRGAQVVLASSGQTVDGVALKALIEEHDITLMQATPATWRLLLAAGFKGKRRLKILCGGEALPRDLALELVARCDELWNMYGPTETTVWSTIQKVTRDTPRILIGRPIGNTTCYVLDERRQPVPPGVVGELHIGGDGVTLGYLRRPELTAERFVADPFAPGQKLYRTGDLARFHSDGAIECLGRNDNQVKVRGYRIELGEIEAGLAAHEGVAQAVVVARDVAPGDTRLIAYLVGRGAAPEAGALKEHLRRTLPEYMLPQHFVALDRFPLTPNGKIDRKALPAPLVEAVAKEPARPPLGATEEKIAAIWREVLGRPGIGRDDDFFELGGHSLLAALAMSRMSRGFDRDLSMRLMFERPTIARLAELIDGAAPARRAERIPRRPPGAAVPLSPMQARLLFIEEMNPGTTISNLSSNFHLKGKLDPAAIQRALDALAARHEAMRTTLQWREGKPVQVIAGTMTIPLPVVDLGHLPGKERMATLHEQLHRNANTPFDVVQGPLVRACLYRLGPEENVLFFMPHHSIWDGWSFDIFIKELSETYDAFRQGKPAPYGPTAVSYADYAVWLSGWLEGAELARQTRYWKEKLGGELPVLELPTDRPRPQAMSYRGRTLAFHLTRAEVDALAEVGRRYGATLYMMLVAAFQAMLARHSGQREILVGTPVRGRGLPELDEVLGFFVNPLVLRSSVDERQTFASLLKQVRQTAIEAFGHQDMPFEVLVRELQAPRDQSRTPVYQAFFTFQDTRNRREAFGDLPYSSIHMHADVCPTDINLWVKERDYDLAGGLNYATDLFDEATMQRFLDRYVGFLRAVTANPELELGRFDMLLDSEKRQLSAWNAQARREHDRTRLVHHLFERQARATPDRVAVVAGGKQLTFRELDARSNRLARALREKGAGRDMLVGLSVDRDLGMIVGVLGILKAGGAYVPLDPAFPADRLAFMIEDSGMKVLVTETGVERELPGHGGAVVHVDRLGDGPADPVACDAAPESLAYVIYTSGSTGKPKGVMLEHRSVVSFVHAMQERPGLGADDVLLAVTTLSFDIAGLEMYLPLSVGARIVIADRETVGDGELLVDAIEEHGVNAMQATPTTWRLMLAEGWKCDRGFKILCGGEAFPRDLAEQLVERSDNVWNMYGPTETTIWSTCAHLQRPLGDVTIGTAIANTTLHVVDPDLRPVPIGIPGELLIGGEGLARGYFRRPELTAERFVVYPDGSGERVYRTGDLVRLKPDGNVEYQRRLDNQVKVRGHRIELGEIEAGLAAHGEIGQAVVIVREDQPGDRRLVGYVVARDKGRATFNESSLRKHLRQGLPDYMVPQHIVTMDELPLTPNGKIDRKRLPAPQGVSAAREDFVAPATEHEKLVAQIWREVLGIDRIGTTDNFFDLGGHSLLCLQVTARIHDRAGVRLNPRVILRNNLAQVAAQLASEARPATPAAAPPLPPAAPPAHAESSSFASKVRRLWNR